MMRPTCGWYMLSDLTLCSGMSTLIKKCLCSSFSGSAKPLMMLQTIKGSMNNYNNNNHKSKMKNKNDNKMNNKNEKMKSKRR